MLNDAVLETENRATSEAGAQHAVREPSWEPKVIAKVSPEARAPKNPQEPESRSRAEQQVAPVSKPSQKSLWRRRPVVSAIGALLLVSVLGGGYVYVDQAGHFQSTDDAFIAARQFRLRRKYPATSRPSR